MNRMIGCLLVFAACIAAAPPEPIDPQTSSSVARGLAFLARQQQADGSFAAFEDLAPRGRSTAAALLAMMSAGQVPTDGRYNLIIHDGLAFLLRTSAGDGYFGLADDSGMSGQSLITTALAEAYGMEGDATQRGQIGPLLRVGLAAILSMQDHRDAPDAGGWGEQGQTPGNLLTTAQAVLALHALRDAGVDVPPDSFHRAAAFARACRKGAAFTDKGQPPTALSNAAGMSVLLLAREISPQDRADLFKSMAQMTPATVEDDSATAYFATLVGLLGNDPEWPTRGRSMWDAVRKKQSTDGSWPPAHPQTPTIGTVLATSNALMSLTVHYRLLPIYPARP